MTEANLTSDEDIKDTVKKLKTQVDGLTSIVNLLFGYIGEMPIPCDKCMNYYDEELETECFKCQESGIIKHKNLFDWPQ